MLNEIETISNIIIKALDVLTKWPVLLFVLLIVFRKQFSSVIPSLVLKLADRIKSLSVAGTTIDFNDLKDKFSEIKDSDLQRTVIQYVDTRIKDNSAAIDEEDIGEDDIDEGVEELGVDEEGTGTDEEFEGVLKNLKGEIK